MTVMEYEEREHFEVPLVNRVPQDASAGLIAQAVIDIWLEAGHSLTPVIGRRGFCALYQRCLALTSSAYPILAVARNGDFAEIDLNPLQAILGQASRADSAHAGAALLQTLHTLLTSLVGVSLTERLLSSAWGNTSRVTPGQNTPHD